MTYAPHKPMPARATSPTTAIVMVLLALALAVVLAAAVLASTALLYFRNRAISAELRLAQERAMAVNLARAGQAIPLTAQAEDLFIHIDREGRYVVDRRAMDVEELEVFLRQKVASNPASLAVTIRPARETPLVAYVAAMNACAEAGIQDVSLVTEGEQ